MKTTVTTVGVVALLLFAGCAGLSGEQGPSAPTSTATDVSADRPTATATPQPTATATHQPPAEPTPEQTETPGSADESDVVVQGGNLSVDEDEVYAQVQALLGTDVAPPTVYVKEDLPRLQRYNDHLASDPFYRTFGYGSEFVDTSVYHGYTTQNRIVVAPKAASEAEVETLLAHEYVHWLQLKSDVADTSGFGEFVDDSDSRHVASGLVEGASVYVTDIYVERYMNVSWNQTTELREQYEAGPAGRRLFRARYLFGAQYVHSEVQDPRNLSRLYDRSTPTPVTAEQLIHGETPEEEPERNLTLSVNASGNWSGPPDQRDTRGEIVVRTMLRAELNESTASTAAAGWGSDEVVQLRHAENRSRVAFAWALRWDDASEADEFAGAFESWTAERPTDDGTTYRLARVDSETVVVFAGDPAFVGDASASGSSAAVQVSTAG